MRARICTHTPAFRSSVGKILKFLLVLTICYLPSAICHLHSGGSLHYVNHWHDHQPVYWPNRARDTSDNRYEYANGTVNNKFNDPYAGHSSCDVFSIFSIDDRTAAYQYRCRDALGTIGGYPEAGFTISYTGALAENIKSLGDAYALGYSPGWNDPWKEARGWSTSGGKTRMDILLTGFHHQLFPLLPDDTLARRIIQVYKQIYPEAWGTHVPQSTGFWPMELAFSERMIPYLLEEGVTWTYVPNTHISRAMPNYPATPGNGMNTEPPNAADQTNPAGVAGWRSASQDGRPTCNDLREAYRPHYGKYIDPDTGTESKIIMVPCADYEGYIDGYGSFPTNLFDGIAAAQDSSRPPLVVLAHDGDNAWGGGYDSYMVNTPNKAGGASGSGYTPSQTAQYLADHPVPVDDVWHIEDGPWVNAAGDFGSPTFSNWNWPWKQDNLPNAPTFDPTAWDDNSQFWGILTAGTNRILTAESYVGTPNMANVLHPTNAGTTDLERAWHYWMAGFDSGHVYYGTAEDFSWIPIIAMNNAMPYCDAIIGSGQISGADTVPPTVWVPQRFPYNPGSLNYGCPYNWQSFDYPSDFDVYSFVYDASGLSSVKLKWRTATGANTTPVEPDNYTYAGGAAVSAWNDIAMSTGIWATQVYLNGTVQDPPPLLPNYMPERCWAHLDAGANKLVDYYIEATDNKGNIQKTAIQHVWVGDGSGAVVVGGTQLWTPENPTASQQITIYGSILGKPGKLHWGVNSWTQPSSEYWPAGTAIYDSQSVETDMLFDGTSYYITVGSFNQTQPVTEVNFVFHWDDDSWDSNGGANWKITISAQDTTPPAVPQRLTPTAKDSSVDLSWQANTEPDLAGYNIYQWIGSDYVEIGSLITNTTHVVSGLDNGTTYSFEITAQDTSGNESGYSVSVTTPPVAEDTYAPQTPIGFAVSGGVEQTSLSWTINLETDLYGYRLYSSSNLGTAFADKVLIATVTAPGYNYTNTGLEAGVTYYYQITSIDNEVYNESEPTSEVSALAQAETPPSAPTGVVATAGNTTVLLKWNPNPESNLAGYNVYRSVTSGQDYSQINGPIITGATTYLDEGRSNGTEYFYRVTAKNTADGESPYSSEVSATPAGLISVVFQVDMRNVPSVTSVNIAGDILTPPWTNTANPLTNQSGVLSGIWTTTINIAAGETLNYKYVYNSSNWEPDFGTAPNNNRTIIVAANNGASTMYVSNKWVIAGDASPLLPTGLVASGQTDGKILVRWNANTEWDLHGYNIYTSSYSSTVGYIKAVSTTTAPEYLLTGLENGNTYYINIDAQDLAGKKSGLCGPAGAIAGTDAPPAVITGLSASAKDSAVDLRWTANTDSDLAGYYVYWSTNSGGPYSSTSAFISSPTIIYTASSLTNGDAHYFVVCASDTAGGLSSYSLEVSATPGEQPDFEERTIDGNFLDWKAADVKGLDAINDTYDFSDGYDDARDIVALYSREGQDNYYFRVDFYELGLYAENSNLNLYITLDFADGGQAWFPDYTECQTDKPWEICLAINDAVTYSVFDSAWGLHNGDMVGVKYNSELDSVELGIKKSLLEQYGFTDGAVVGIQCFTTKDGTNDGAGEIPGTSDIADAVADDGRGFDDGVLNGNTLSTASTGRAKYSIIYHGNQSINFADDIRDWIYREETAHTPTGYSRGLDTVDNYGIKVNIHPSGTLASAMQWAQPSFNVRIASMVADGKAKIIGGVVAEHMMPYFENGNGRNINSDALIQGTTLLVDIYNLSAQPRVFWTPERVIRGSTFDDIITRGDGSPSGYAATVLDDKTHLRDWYGIPDSQIHKVHKINNVICFLNNGRGRYDAAPDMSPDGTKFWLNDNGLHMVTRALLLGKAMDADQEQLVLVFDDWEAYAGRSFTSALPNDNADQWDLTARWIANHQWIETVTLEDILDRGWSPIDHGINTSLSVKTYDWLLHACEESYDNWYWGSGIEESFSNRIPKIKGGTNLPNNYTYGHKDTAGTILCDTWDAILAAPDNQLKDLAKIVYNTMIYETAWHDEDNSDKYSADDNTYDNISCWALYLQGHVRYAVAISSASKWASEVAGGGWTTTSVQQQDVDLDGEDEYVLKNNKVFAVFENDGGRMIMGFAYDSVAGAFQMVGAPAVNYEYEGEEEGTKHCSAFKEVNGGTYVNDAYTAAVWTSSITLTSSDGNIKKIISLADGSDTLRADYTETVAGALYIRFGLSPNVWDMYFAGKDNLVELSSSAYYGMKNVNGGQVYVTYGGTVLNSGYTDGTSDNTRTPHTKIIEVSGSDSFSVSLTMNSEGAVDATPPRNITDLAAVAGANDGEAVVSWTAPGDDADSGNNTDDAVYTFKYSTFGVSGGDMNSWWSQSSEYTQSWPVLSQGAAEQKTITGLNDYTLYYFGVKTTDESNNTSGIEIVASAWTIADSTAPAQITTLFAQTGTNDGEINLSWLAPGDDGTVGDLTGIWEIKYSTASNLLPYSLISLSTASVVPLSTRYSSLTGLIHGSTYYINMRTKDEGTWSSLSNETSAWARIDTEAPDAVTTLSALTGGSPGEINLSWISPGDDGTVGDLTGIWEIKYSTVSTLSPYYLITLSTDSLTPLSDCYLPLTGLADGSTYYFVIRSSDELNWSELSNDASAWAQIDNIAPSQITSVLAYRTTVYGEVRISWTSPGDDGTVGNLTGAWDIRYSTAEDLSVYDGIEVSTYVAALSFVSYNISDLLQDTTYYFAVTARDEIYNWSVLSGTSSIQVDNIPPDGVSDLTALTGTNEREIVLQWTAPGDDGTVGNAIAFRINYSSVGIVTSDNFASASSSFSTVVNISTSSLAPLSDIWYLVSGLSAGTSYWFAVRTEDDVDNWSVWNSSKDVLTENTSAYCPAQAFVPAAVTDLSAVTGTTGGTVILTWTSPKEDGETGGSVSSYDIRYATYSFGDSEFSSLSAVTEPPSPATPGTLETKTAGGLTGGTVYYFAVKSLDDAGLTSPIDTTATQANAAAKTTQELPKPPIYIAFHWHMHQPIYYPYETAPQVDDNGRFSFSVVGVHNDRTGPYTSWPNMAIQKGVNAGLKHLGAGVSFSGSLMENINAIVGAGRGYWSGWQNDYIAGRNSLTQAESSVPPGAVSAGGGNPRLDIMNFGYHHPLMGLIDYADTRRQIQLYKKALANNFGTSPVAYSKGIFPPENAFRPEMIPALVDENIEWVLIDNIHFDRAVAGYPWSSGSNLYEPNAADQLNNPSGITWLQLVNIWAGSKVSVPWGYKPHYVSYKDPATGTDKKIIAVPGARYEGNEDARGGFGALQYEAVMSQYEAYNTDAQHPMLVVLPHDGDNYGGGTYSYYDSNFQAFVNWLQANPGRFVCTTVQDYLDMFPPAANDVIHVENGSWSGADNGDPEFLKWNGAPDAGTGYSFDRNSWAIMTAAKNRVDTAEDISPASSLDDILYNTGNDTAKAWYYYYSGQTSCYWYWDGTEIWDSNPARAANSAVYHADMVLGGNPADSIGPTVSYPQRTIYNPGGDVWGIERSNDFTVWSCVYDVSGLGSVVLKYRIDSDGTRDSANDIYSGGTWNTLVMNASSLGSQTNPQPAYKADEYSAEITGQSNVLVDYYVEAADTKNNITKSAIMHVYVGQGSGPSPETERWTPAAPTKNDTITVYGTANKAGKLHWGVNGWTQPPSEYLPAGTAVYDSQSVETPLIAGVTYYINIGPFNGVQTVNNVDFVFHYDDGEWDNNGGSNWNIPISQTSSSPTVTITYPANYSSVSSTVNISASCQDDVGISTTAFYYKMISSDTWIFISSVTVSPYNADLNTTLLQEDTFYLLMAMVWDTDGYSGTSPEVTVRTNNTNSAPVVTVGFPDGGELLDGTTNVTWVSSDIDEDTLNITLDYSTSGVNWSRLATSINDVGEYSWNTTLLDDATTYLVRVIAEDSGGLTGLDASNAIFSITNKPSAITSLSALTQTAAGSIKLTWTTPGADGTLNTASGYDIRYSTDEAVSPAISTETFAASVSVSIYSAIPSPQASMTEQTFTITGLIQDTTYYFAVRTNDEVPIWSELSNEASAWVLIDNVPPSAITNLSALTGSTAGAVQLQWTSQGDDGEDGVLQSGSEYRIQYSSAEEVIYSTNSYNISVPTSSVTPDDWQYYTVTGLESGATYYFAIWTKDDSMWSEISNMATAQVLSGDNVPPGAITDLTAVSGPDYQKITLSWTSPGNDNYTGTASSYTVRYRTDAEITEANWATSTDAGVLPPIPSVAGTFETLEINNLTPGVTYYFAIKSTDTTGNVSDIDSVSPRPYARAAGTYHNIVVDGGITEWNHDIETMDLRNNNTFFLTWSSTAVYICYAGPDVNTATNDFFVLFDTHTAYQQEKGTIYPVANWDGAENHILPFYADSALCVEGSTYKGLRKWTGSSWNDPGDGVGIEANSLGTTVNEISILWSTLDNPTTVRVMMFHKWDGSKHVYNSYPPENPAPNNENIVEFTHFYELNITSGVFPSAAVVQTTVTAGVDITAPDAITALSALTGELGGTINLSWIAPGDDGLIGQITDGSWEIRYSTVSTLSNYQLITVSTSSIQPLSPISYLLSGLSHGSTYYFNIWTTDESNNRSAISNDASTWAQVDVSPPSAITTLTAAPGTYEAQIKLTWLSPGDDGTMGHSSSYDIRYSTVPEDTPALSDANFSAADSVSVFSPLPVPQIAGNLEWVTLTGLEQGATYYFAMKSSDAESRISELSNGATTWAQADVTAPGNITDFSGSPGSAESDVNLAWSSPGDDALTGDLAGSFEIKYSTLSAMSPYNIINISTTSVPLSAQSYVVTGLEQGKTFYFDIRALDERQNASLASRTTTWAQIDALAPSQVTTLSALTGDDPCEIKLSWISPGDDGTVGQITEGSWEIRYSTVDTLSPYSLITLSTSSIQPLSPISYLLTGLSQGSTYYIEMRAGDELTEYKPVNWSELSNRATAWVLVDDIAPAAITNLSALASGIAGEINLSWTSQGDDGETGVLQSGSEYRIQYSSSEEVIYSTNNYNISVPTSSVVPDDWQYSTVTGLEAGSTYYFVIWTKDESMWSEISNMATAQVLAGDSTAPGAITDLVAVSGPDYQKITLRWTAPGGDNYSGTASSYTVRYRTNAEITGSNWDTSTDVSILPPVPSSAGTFETLEINNLTPGLTYYFALKSTDTAGNVSEIDSVSPRPYARAAGTYHNIVVDGGISEWHGGTEKMDTDNTKDFYVTWSSTAVYICYTNNVFSDMDLFVMIDTHTTYGVDKGTTCPPAWESMETHTLPFYADYALAIENASYKSLRYWNGSEWTDPGNGVNIESVYINDSTAGGNSEIAILRSRLDDPDTIRIVALHKWDTQRNIFNSFPVENPAPNTDTACEFTYFYEFNLSSGIIPSDTVVKSTISVVVPAPPTELTAVVYTSSITWGWSDNATNEDGYSVKTSTGGELGTVPADVSEYLHEGLTPNTTYSVYVEAYNVTGTSGSVIISTMTHAVVPAGTYIVSRTSYSIDIAWSENSNPDYTRWGILRSTDDFVTFTTTLTVYGDEYTAIDYSDTDLDPAVTYYYKICAFDTNDETATDCAPTVSTQTLSLSATISPDQISDLSGLTGELDGEVVLSWTAPGGDGAEGDITGGEYILKYSTNPLGSNEDFEIGTSTFIYTSTDTVTQEAYSLTVTGLNPGTSYYFALKYRDDTNNWAGWSTGTYVNEESTAAAQDLDPAAITALTALSGNTVITLEWTVPDAPADVNDYEKFWVYRATWSFTEEEKNDEYVEVVATVAYVVQQSTSYIDTGLTNLTTYWYHISLWDTGDAEDGNYSVPKESFSVVEVSTFSWETLPSAPSDMNVSVLFGATSIYWQFEDNSDNETELYISSGIDTTMRLSSNLADMAFTGTTYWLETDISTNTECTRYAEAVNTTGSVWSVVITSYTYAVVPGALTANTSFQNSIELEWTANDNPGPTRYGIAHSTNSDFATAVSTFVEFASGLTELTTAAYDLLPESTYYFRLWAYNGDEAATAYVEGSTVTLPTSPDQISDLSALTGGLDGEVILSWTAPGDDGTVGQIVDGRYEIKYSTNPIGNESGFTSAATYVQNSTDTVPLQSYSLTVTGLNPGTSYYFALKYRDDTNNWASWSTGTYVNEESTASAQDLDPAAVTALTAQSGNTVITLEWTVPDAPADVNDYEKFWVYRATWSFTEEEKDDEFVDVVATVTYAVQRSTSYVDTGLTNLTTYWYHISLWDTGDVGDGLYSVPKESFSVVEVSTFSWDSPPEVPSNFTGAAQSSHTIQWTWDDVSNESGYRVKSTTAPTDTVSESLAADVVSWDETGLFANTSYYRVVVATNSDGESQLSNPSTTYTFASPPIDPIIFTSVGYSSVTLQWTGHPDNPAWTRYGVIVSSNPECFGTTVSTPVAFSDDHTVNSTTTVSLTADTTYYFRIIAFNEDQIQTAYIQDSTTTIVSIPAVPSDLKVSELVGSTSIYWQFTDNADNESELYISSGDYTRLSENLGPLAGTGGTTSWWEINLGTNTPCTRYAEASNMTESIWSAVITSYTAAAVPLESYVINRTSYSIEIGWSNNDNPGYTRWGILRSTEEFITSTTTLKDYDSNYTALAYTDTAVDVGTTYWYKLQAYNGDGIETAFDATVSTETMVEAPALPSDLKISVLMGATSIYWEFTDNSNNETELYISSGADVTMRLSGNLADTAYTGTTYWLETELSTNTAYTRYAEAKNTSGSVWSDVISSYTAATVPSESYVINRTSYSTEIGWSNNDNPGYTRWGILRSTEEFITSTTTLKDYDSNYTALAYTDTMVNVDTTYWYKLQAYNEDGIETAFDATVSTFTLPASPSSPADLKISILLGATSIYWEFADNSNNETELYVSSGADVTMRLSGNLADEAFTGTTYWAEMDLSTNTIYTRYAEASNMTESIWSAVISSYTAAAVPLESYVINRTSYSIEIGWSNNDNPGYTRWGVLRSTDDFTTSTTTFKNYDDNYTALAYTDTMVNVDTTYWYKLQAYNEDGIETAFDTTVSTATLPLELAAPFDLKISVLMGAASIYWQFEDNSDNETGLYVSSGPDIIMRLSGNLADAAYTGTTYWLETELSTNTAYIRYAEVENASGSIWSEFISSFTAAAVPGPLTANTSSQNSIELIWTANDNPGSTVYGISYSTDSNYVVEVTTFVNFASGLTDLTTAAYELTAETTYYFRLWAYNGDGIETAYVEASSSVVLDLTPAAPSVPNASLIGTTSIQWQFTDNAFNETELYLSAGADTGMRLSEGLGVISGTGQTTSWWEINLSTNSAYTRYAESYNLSGSNWSAASSSYTLACPPSDSSVVSASSVAIMIQWSANTNPAYTRWEILCSTDNFINTTVLKDFGDNYTETGYSDTGLENETMYYYKVRAFNENGIATDYDATISTPTPPPYDSIAPNPPSGLIGIKDSSGKISGIKWSVVENNEDDTICLDLKYYRIYQSTALDGGWVMIVDVSSATYEYTGFAATGIYFKVTAIDTNGNESSLSTIIDTSFNIISVAKENGVVAVSLTLPEEISSILNKDTNQYGEDIRIEVRRLTLEEDAKDVAVYEFAPVTANSGQELEHLEFGSKCAEISFQYDKDEDAYIDKIGVPVAEAKNWLAIFYYNNIEWMKLGGDVNEQKGSIGIRTSHLSKYKVRKSLRTIGFGDLRLEPKKIFAPEDPVWNTMTFRFENDAAQLVQLKIFDIKGRLIYSASTSDNEISWNGKNDDERTVSSGVYIYQLDCDGSIINGTIVVAR